MEKILLFVDVSYNKDNDIGCGAFLILNKNDIYSQISLDNIEFNFFENTSSTILELQNVIYALKKINEFENEIYIYTDSQNIISLIQRRENLEKNNFKNNKGNYLKNAELYKEFFYLFSNMNLFIHKIKGHKIKSQKNIIENVFSEVDKFSRKKLRIYIQSKF